VTDVTTHDLPEPERLADPEPDAEPDAGPDAGPEQDALAPPAPDGEKDVVTLEHEGDVAADYLEALLDIADLDGDIDMDVEGTRAVVSLVGGDLSTLVGPNGVVLEALQELTRLAVLRETGNRSRLMLDVDGFRARRRDTLTQQGKDAAAKVKATGESVRMAPMTPFERKVVHDAVAAEGLRSESEGEEPHRRVVVLPA
jgi:spoIIIJ-associated protein